MKFGLTEEQYQWVYENIAQVIKQQGGVLFCYGSRARGDHSPFSDLDLMIEGGDIPNHLLFELRENASESLFPYKIDLVKIDEFAAAYREGYESDKVPF